MHIIRTFASLLITSVFAVTSLAAEKPNILWIFSEDLSPYMGCYDDPINKDHTPNIDKLAAEGTIFKRTFVPAPVCSACRSALITGVYQTTSGTHQHRSSRATDGTIVEPSVRIHLPEGMKTIPEIMREAGYFTFNQGKDDYNFHYDRRKLYSTGTEPDYKAGMNGWQGNHAVDQKDFRVGNWKTRPDKSQPWFGQITIWGGKDNSKYTNKEDILATNDVPIPPYFPDTPVFRKAWTAHYNAARGADNRVQQILDELKADGELENTIVFFFSDHGNNHSLRHKQFCYEGGLHVPFIIRGNHPKLKAGTVRNELVNGLDIPATTLALADVSAPDYLDGVDLFATDYKPRTHVVSARDRCDYTIDRIRSVRTDRYRYIRNYFVDRPILQAQYRDGRGPSLALRKGLEAGTLTPYQANFWFGVRPTEELYDVIKDPHQIHNLALDHDYIEQLSAHRTMLEQWIHDTGDKGQYAESASQLKGTFELWKDRPVFRDAQVNPEYDQFR